jgi:hypothetical protein
VPVTQLQDLGDAPALQQQLDAIGSLDHHTENIARFDGQGTLGKKSCSYYPLCFVTCAQLSGNKLTPHFFRVRLLHYLLRNDTRQLLALFNDKISVVERTDDMETSQSEQPAVESATRSGRARRMTVEELQETLGVEVPPVTNMAS